MRTRAQASRDAALRRLTRVNRSLAVAAVVGAGVITDVVANSAPGHARTITTTGETSGSGKVELLTSPQRSPTRKPRAHRHPVVKHHSAATSGAASSSPAAKSPPATSSPPAASGSQSSSQSLQSSPPPSSSASSSSGSSSAASTAASSAGSSSSASSVQQTVQPTVVAVSGGS